MSESGNFSSKYEYMCFVKRDAQKGYIFTGWKDDKKAEGVRDDDVFRMLSRLPQDEWGEVTIPVCWPIDDPRWLVRVERKEIPREGARPEYEFIFYWYSKPKGNLQFWKGVGTLLLMLVCGCIGAGIEYYLWSESLKEQETEVRTIVQGLEKKVDNVSDKSGKMVEEWNNSKEYFDIFTENEKVKDLRGDRSNTEDFVRIEFSKGRDTEKEYYTIGDYEQICKFLNAMKDFAGTQDPVAETQEPEENPSNNSDPTETSDTGPSPDTVPPATE